MTTTITGAAITTATVAATTSVTTDLIQYDTAKNEAGGFTKQQVVQVVNVQSGASATGTTVIPDDDTIPQNTEGDEYLTLAITPKSASNILVIEAVMNLSNSSAATISYALFQDSTAGALQSGLYYGTEANDPSALPLTHYMVSGTTSATTFKIRAGLSNSNTTTFNGFGGNRKRGGVLMSSITITEYTP
jgi:hypothetical protein